MSADLKWLNAPKDPEAVVLVLHGGADKSHATVHWYDHAVLRMLPIAWAVTRASRSRIAVALLRNEVRGWNGDQASPLPGARSALDDISNRFPGLPIGLAGHSMGARVATHLLPDPRVRAVLGLAPWIDRADIVDVRRDQTLLLAHGSRDSITSPAMSRMTAARLASAGRQASYLAVLGGDHPMLRRWATWDGVVGAWAARALLDADPAYRVDPAVRAAVRRSLSGSSQLEL